MNEKNKIKGHDSWSPLPAMKRCHGLCFSWMKRCVCDVCFRFLSLSEKVTGWDIGSFISSLGENGTKYHFSHVSATSFRAEKH